ncbi:T9SS type A sorting domain-containing protein [bacterium]|nr:T9SS type A sorting domain-containing protein [bacterium]
MKSRVILVSLLVMMMGISFAQSDPHVVFGALINADGSAPNPDCMIFESWVTTRPTEILTQDSPGCDFEDSLWFVNTGNFPTAIADGEELSIWLRDTCLAETLTVSGNVDLSYPEENWGSFELIEEGETPIITVLTPNGGDSYVWDDPIDITWTSLDLTGNVKIEYSMDGGVVWNSITGTTLDDGAYAWIAPHITSEIILFKISSVIFPTVFDVSDGFTEIVPEPSIELVYPNGGEILTVDEIVNVRWDVIGDEGPFELHISRDGGGTWTLISGGLAGRGNLDWTAVGPASDNCLIRVRAEDDVLFSDVSDAVFEIVDLVGLTMVFPNGGEVLFIDSIAAITWDAGDVEGDLELLFSRDNGDSWTPLADGLGARGVFNWDVTGPTSEECFMQVRSESDTTIFDNSDAVFEIGEYIPPVEDSIAPSQIIDLVVIEVQHDRAHLAWSAPGDDGTDGTAASYTMGYDLTAFTWPATWEVAGMPMPEVAGTPQDIWIEGLAPETEYYAAMIAEDEEPNASPMSNMVNFSTSSAPDTIPPAGFDIDTLVARDVSFDGFTIFWDAPGDDGNIGTADNYDFRLSTFAFLAGDFETMPEVVAGVPIPEVAGSRQTLIINGLTPDTDYWIAGKASDEVLNDGPVSNIIHVRTHEYTDLIPVGNIIDLSCGDLDMNAIELIFTAPGDDGWAGTVGIGYEVRFLADSAFDPIDWAFVDVYDTIPPVPGRTEVSYYVTGLDQGRQYFFVVRGLDDDGPASLPSDLAGCWTLGRVNPLPDIVMDEDDPDMLLEDIFNIFNPPSGLTYGVTSSEDGIDVSIADSQDILVSLEENYFGEGWIIISATDGEDILLDSVYITVNPVNDAPIFITMPAETLVLDGFPWEYMAIAIDIEDDPVEYGLISGPVGLEVDISGYATWLPSSIEGTYTINIGAWDGADTSIQEFDIVVIKYSYSIFKPHNLHAWDGFRDCVPVVWQAPLAVGRDLPVHLSHYRLYRSEYYDYDYSVLIDSLLFNSYCDNTVVPGELYFYKVQAVYSDPDFNSGFSNIDGGASLASNWLYSSYTIGPPPMVDGDLNEEVWFESTDIDLFSEFGILLSNSGSFLNIGLTNPTLSIEDGFTFRFFFDDNNDDEWDADSSTEGYYEVVYNSGAESVVYFHPLQPDSIEPEVISVGAVAEWLDMFGAGFNTEMVIDMSVMEEFFALPSETVGVAFQILDSDGDTFLNWPSGANPSNPSELAHLVLGSPGGLPSLIVSPPIIIASVETGWATNKPIRLHNYGDGTIIWSLDESADWLEITPENGVVPPGTYIEIDARLISGIMPTGLYNTTITFSSNDPLNPEQELPVEMTVTPRVPSHYLSVFPPAETSIEPGSFVEIPIYIGELYGNEITQLDFTIMTDREFLIPLEVNRGINLPPDWNFVVRNIYNDRVLLRLYGHSPLPASGELVKVRYAVESGILEGRSSRVEITDLLFNYDLDELPIPIPGNGVIIVGEELRYFWYGMLRYLVEDVQQDSVRFGLLDAATDNYDYGIDVMNTPPHSLFHDAWFLSNDWKYLGTDIRSTGCEVRWELWFESDGSIEWDPCQMWPGVMIDGVVDMSVDSTYEVSTETPVIITYDGTPGNYIWQIDLHQGWNMLSAPLQASSMSVSSLFPSAMGNAWAWDPTTANYYENSTIDIGEGYWILSSIDTSYTRTGNIVYSYERDLPNGWLILGSPAHRTYLADQDVVPEDAFVSGTFYYWNAAAEISTYESTSFFTPGFGQWIYCRFPATLEVTSIYLPKDIPSEDIKPVFEGRLFLAEDSGQSVIVTIGDALADFPIPPPAPGKSNRLYLDGELPLMARTLVGKEAEWTGKIDLAKSQTLSWSLFGAGEAEIEIDGAKFDMRETNDIHLSIGTHSFKVVYSRAVPEKIALHGNMPNPFNATTAITFDLPEKMDLSLTIFDMTGRSVSSIAEGEFESGTHRIIWNGRSDKGIKASSGVYFIVLKAGKTNLQRKMLLIK